MMRLSLRFIRPFATNSKPPKGMTNIASTNTSVALDEDSLLKKNIHRLSNLPNFVHVSKEDDEKRKWILRYLEEKVASKEFSFEDINSSLHEQYDSIQDRLKDKKVSNAKKRVLSVDRVSSMRKSGRVFSFRALTVTGNGSAAGFGHGKGSTVGTAIDRALSQSYKDWVPMNFTEYGSLYHDVRGQHNQTTVLLRACAPSLKERNHHPVVKAISEVCGLKNLTSKVLGRTNNPYTVTYAYFKALALHQTPEEISRLTGKKIVVVNPYSEWRRSSEKNREHEPEDIDLPELTKGDPNWIG